MAKYIVPSKAASGKQTFDDNLVGFQITDGTSQLTNTNFDLDRVIPQKDSKNFKTNPFSDFLTLDNLKKETNAPTTQSSTSTTQDKIKFKNAKKDAGRSLYGSLAIRLSVSISKIIEMFPAAFLIDKDGFISASNDTATNIVYNSVDNTTTFDVEGSKLFNPFDITLSKPNSDTLPDTTNGLRSFFSSYKNYVVRVNGEDYPIVNYTEPTSKNVFTLKMTGKPFPSSTYSDNILVKPNNGMVEEFFNGLDEIETQLLNRESNPIYNATFVVPKDSFDQTTTNLISVQYNWPVSKDNWNIQIAGSNFDNYVDELSSLATEIDDYKSNLIVRFLTSPQLYEFDSDDQKAESVFQLYGQSFDRVKKYIDNIAYMRNISYDGMDNLPDILLKNLSETLGLSTVNLFDEKSFEDSLYDRLSPTYVGESIGKNVLEAEYEFYRRILVNLAHIYKSKGTRSSINFFLKFLGAPEPLIKINEYIYRVTSLPKIHDIQSEIFDLIAGTKIKVEATYDETLSAYTKTVTKLNTTFDRSGYPVDETTGLPRTAFNSNNNTFFQKGSGWYDINLHHRSPDILDTEKSVLTGRTKTLLTKAKAYSYGEEYFDNFRTLPGLDIGYQIKSEISTLKGDVDNGDGSYILNRKNIDVFLDASNGVNYDIWRKSSQLDLNFGSLPATTGVTFAQFLNSSLNKLIKNSNVVRYKKNYITLEEVYQSYSNSNNFIPYTIMDVHEFIKKMSPYWTSVIEQIIPSTTLWKGGNLIKNSLLGRPKYKYNKGCAQMKFDYDMDLYPDFISAIDEDLAYLLSEEENFRGLISITGVTYTPIIEIDGFVYQDHSYKVVVSSTGNTLTTAKLFDAVPMSGCTILENRSVTELPLTCGYEYHTNPDLTKIKSLWLTTLTNFIDNVVNLNDNIISYVVDGNKINFNVLQSGPRDCSSRRNFAYKFDGVYDLTSSNCGLCLSFEANNLNTIETTSIDLITGDTIISNVYNCDIYITTNNVFGIQNQSKSTDIYNTTINYDYPFEVTRLSNCQYFISGYTYSLKQKRYHGENPPVTVHTNYKNNLIFLDAANCEYNVEINKIEQVKGSITTGVTVNYVNRGIYNHGLKNDSYVYYFDPVEIVNVDINNLNTDGYLSSILENYYLIPQSVSDLIVGDTILCIDNDSLLYSAHTISHKEGLASNKIYTITGSTTGGTYLYQVLPTMKLKVYTNKTVNGKNITNSNYHKEFRYPMDLQIKNGNIKGDYLIDVFGDLIEVIDTSFRYCTSDLFFNLNFDNVTNDIIVLNGGDYSSPYIQINNTYQEHIEYVDETCPTPVINLLDIKTGGYEACLYKMISTPDNTMLDFECTYTSNVDLIWYKFTVNSLIINGGTDYITKPISEYVSKTSTNPFIPTFNTINWISANNNIVSGCTLGNVTGLTYTNFVDLLNNVFNKFGLSNYKAQVSLYSHDFFGQQETGFYIVRPSGDTFTMDVKYEYWVNGDNRVLDSDVTTYNETPEPTDFSTEGSGTCDGYCYNYTLSGQEVIEGDPNTNLPNILYSTNSPIMSGGTAIFYFTGQTGTTLYDGNTPILTFTGNTGYISHSTLGDLPNDKYSIYLTHVINDTTGCYRTLDLDLPVYIYVPYNIALNVGCGVNEVEISDMALTNNLGTTFNPLPYSKFPIKAQDTSYGSVIYSGFSGPFMDTFDFSMTLNDNVNYIIINGNTYYNNGYDMTEIDNEDDTYTYLISSLTLDTGNSVTIYINGNGVC